MTPLAQRIVRELTLPLKERTFEDHCGLLRRMDDIHCFEVTAIDHPDGTQLSAAYQLSLNVEAFNGAAETTFLPAPKTWIESASSTGRFGWLVEGDGESGIVRVQNVLSISNGGTRPDWCGTFGDSRLLNLHASRDNGLWEPEYKLIIYLAFINSPRVIGREAHAAHRGLARSLRAAAPTIGGFRLHEWTEIKLDVALPADADTGVGQTHLTGKKALHFCRSHLRVRLGRLEIVRAHWRGDGALGIRQSNYVVAP